MRTKYPIATTVACLALAAPALGAQGNDPEAARREATRLIAPDAVRALVIPQHLEPVTEAGTRRAARFPEEFRNITGVGNNGNHGDWGAAGVPFLRLTGADYENGHDSPAGQHRASARLISNAIVAQPGSIPNAAGASDFLWQWGQFIDHDLDLAPAASPAEPFDIAIPTGDPFFDPTSTGTATMALNRSAHQVVRGVREQINILTAYIDGSMVYGSDEERAQALRTLDGTGRLKTSAGNLLPFNVDGLPNAPGPGAEFFLAGDERVNEQIGLTAMHTLFVREHNFWADVVGAISPFLDDDGIYEFARAIVIGEIQAITYREFLPLLLGPRGVATYRGYRPGVNAGVSNEFATAAYRVGHTMLSPQLLRLDASGAEIPEGNLPLAEAFFRPDHVITAGIDPILRGLASQPAQEIDNFIVDAVRNFLFGPPGAGGFDLASLNIQRGREHGLAGYNQVRSEIGLRPVRRFRQINPDPAVQARLESAYPTVDDIDLWVGGLAEPHVRRAVVGPTFHAILKDQFERVRDGDRFWYQTYLPAFLVDLVEQQTLAVVIRRNTEIGAELQPDAFRLP
jgi:hypothetical protein